MCSSLTQYMKWLINDWHKTLWICAQLNRIDILGRERWWHLCVFSWFSHTSNAVRNIHKSHLIEWMGANVISNFALSNRLLLPHIQSVGDSKSNTKENSLNNYFCNGHKDSFRRTTCFVCQAESFVLPPIPNNPLKLSTHSIQISWISFSVETQSIRNMAWR